VRTPPALHAPLKPWRSTLSELKRQTRQAQARPSSASRSPSSLQSHPPATRGRAPQGGPAARTAVSVRERGRALDWPPPCLGMMRRLATSTTSLPLNFFSSSRTSRCCTRWNALSSLYGTCARAAPHAPVRLWITHPGWGLEVGRPHQAALCAACEACAAAAPPFGCACRLGRCRSARAAAARRGLRDLWRARARSACGAVALAEQRSLAYQRHRRSGALPAGQVLRLLRAAPARSGALGDPCRALHLAAAATHRAPGSTLNTTQSFALAGEAHVDDDRFAARLAINLLRLRDVQVTQVALQLRVGRLQVEHSLQARAAHQSGGALSKQAEQQARKNSL